MPCHQWHGAAILWTFLVLLVLGLKAQLEDPEKSLVKNLCQEEEKAC